MVILGSSLMLGNPAPFNILLDILDNKRGKRIKGSKTVLEEIKLLLFFFLLSLGMIVYMESQKP